MLSLSKDLKKKINLKKKQQNKAKTKTKQKQKQKHKQNKTKNKKPLTVVMYDNKPTRAFPVPPVAIQLFILYHLSFKLH